MLDHESKPAADVQRAASNVEPRAAAPKDQLEKSTEPKVPNNEATSAVSSVSALTKAFSKRQGAVQNCFATHAGALKGSPQVSIRFDLTTSGSVNSATVSPGSVAGTSLGQCLQGVAKATSFPAQEKAVAFSIPIVARVVTD